MSSVTSQPTKKEKRGMKRNWETKPTTGPIGFLNTSTMMLRSSCAPMLMELRRTKVIMTMVKMLLSVGLFMMM